MHTESTALRKRLWQGSGLIVVFLITLLVGNQFIAPDKSVTRAMIGHDFLVFYFAGDCARTGQYMKMYDLQVAKEMEHRAGQAAGLEMTDNVGPWWNPPFAAWMYAPLSALPFAQARLAWWIIGFVALAISCILMMRMLPNEWKTRLLVPMLILTCSPFMQAFDHGQNTFVSLLILSIVVTLWRAERAVAAGLVCGLLFYKPQLGAVVAAVLCLHQGRRAMLGVAATGAALLLINLITMPGSLWLYLHQLPANLAQLQDQNTYLWERHITFKGFWRLLLQGRGPGSLRPATRLLWYLSEAALGGALLALVFKTLRRPTPASRDRLIAAAIVSMPLLMPFYFDYDLLLTSVGAVLYAADRMRGGRRPEDRWIVCAWAAMYLALEFGGAVGGATRFQPVVPLAAVVAALLIRRALRPESSATASLPQTVELSAPRLAA